MSDHLSDGSPLDSLSLAPPRDLDPSRSAWHGGSLRTVLLQGLAVLVLFAVAGLVGGWVWHLLWDAPSGSVTDGVWFTDEAGLRDDFAGTGLYVVLAGGAGLVLGGLSALLLARSELVTLLTVTVGSVLAAWLMWRVGMHLSPPDPQLLARTAADDSVLPGALRIHGRTPYIAFPAGALVALTAVFLTVVGPRGGKSFQD